MSHIIFLYLKFHILVILTMGIDGTNVLRILGSSKILDTITALKASVPTRAGEPIYYDTLRNEYFAKATYKRNAPNCLEIVYDFRTKVCEEYLTDLLKTYPTCWMKNEYNADDGSHGVWIASIQDNEVVTQKHEWTELSWEEVIFYGMPA